jgi:2-keto-4-pentenoate hydratase
MTDISIIEKAASVLRCAEETRESIAPLREQFPKLDLDGAYAVQRLNIERRVKAGRRIVGCKIGLTSLAVQRQLGVDEPDCGTLVDDMEFHDGLPIPLARLQQPKIEAEVAFVLGRDIEAESPGVVDVMRGIEYVLPALEIVGSRIRDWNIKIVDTVADNASSSGYVLGGTPRKLAGLDLRDCAMQMRRDGEEISSGRGSACLGHPLNAVVWLARVMARNGTPLRAGQLVLSGALGPMAPVTGPHAFEAHIEGLGKVAAVFAQA